MKCQAPTGTSGGWPWLTDGSCIPDNDDELSAHAVRGWLECFGVDTLYIEWGGSWENGYVASFNGTLRDEMLDREIF